jgi:hypothetical protein
MILGNRALTPNVLHLKFLFQSCLFRKRKTSYLCAPFENGLVAERLGTALQKLLQRFESARDLRKFINAVAHLSRNGVFLFIAASGKNRLGQWQIVK